jgi:hypothetical protein
MVKNKNIYFVFRIFFVGGFANQGIKKTLSMKEFNLRIINMLVTGGVSLLSMENILSFGASAFLTRQRQIAWSFFTQNI